MSDKNHHIRSYTVEELKRYLEGKMPPEEMHALERASMEDPFLADALDGIAMYLNEPGSQPFETAMRELDKRMEEKIASKKQNNTGLILPFWAKSAAAVVILLALGYLTDHFLFRKKPETQNIAKSKEPLTAPDTNGSKKEESMVGMDSASTKPVTENNIQPPSLAEKTGSGKAKEVTPEKKAAIAQDRAANAAAPIAGQGLPAVVARKEKADEMDKTKQVSGFVQDTLAVLSQKKEDDKSTRKAVVSAAAITPPASVFKGVVIDANSMPVEGAVVKLSNSKNKAVTNSKGEFNIGLVQNSPKISLEVNATGYSPRLLELNQTGIERNIISLDPDSSSLKEVVVSEYRANQIRESKIDQRNSADLNADIAIPVDGWKAFYEYLNRNKKINTADSILKGTEIISFQVDKDRRLSSFRAEQSISKAHHAEAVRLIRQGPAWICLKGNKQRVTIYINF